MKSTPSLFEQAEAVHTLIRASGGLLRPPEPILEVLLAQFFSYNITKGGFAQLIYSAQGEHLQAIEQMLIAANATIAGQFYERAINLCIANPNLYEEFLSHKFTTENELKNSLHRLSIEYFREKRDFEQEADLFIKSSSQLIDTWVHEQ